ncbi:lysylphosphatidylglycerol synthase transmembrane domain-containing protein [Nocardioides sambongensis]|uniref:lysylphosphatidylglycerol synthase transmembrane domain-containing protein n=1 Tax=Nocardioides sambongensis TaxID=2589074 RepID=UPI00112A1591|nr:YbhN family protein [Nocardioides sambongensis]
MSRAHALLGARILFVLLTVGFAWWGFEGRWAEISAAIGRTGVARLLGAALLTTVGLGLTGVLWRGLLIALGTPIGPREAGAVFFVGQLGKYVPGSVWSFAAQAQLGRRHHVPVRSSVTASSLFLLVHTFTGVLLGSALAALGVLPTPIAAGWWVVIAVGSAAVLCPPVVRRLGDRLAGEGVATVFGVRELGLAGGLMCCVWLCYGAGLAVLLSAVGPVRPDDLLVAVGAFALAHAAGVLLVLAPAGLGAREGVLIAVLSPAVGVGPAAAAALLSRLVHAIADFAMAGLAALAALPRVRRSPTGSGSCTRPDEAPRAVDA